MMIVRNSIKILAKSMEMKTSLKTLMRIVKWRFKFNIIIKFITYGI